MVVFSTPAFCGTQTCGPQLEVAEALELHMRSMEYASGDWLEVGWGDQWSALPPTTTRPRRLF